MKSTETREPEEAMQINAKRYQRLRILGCAPMDTEQLKDGTVLRFTSLDEFVDRDMRHMSSRGEAAPLFDMKFSERFLRDAAKSEDGVVWNHPPVETREPEIPEPQCILCGRTLTYCDCAQPQVATQREPEGPVKQSDEYSPAVNNAIGRFNRKLAEMRATQSSKEDSSAG